jgi:hypothetical protein
MADANKPEVVAATGDHSPHRQPAEPPGEPRREPPPPDPEKQPPQHSSSSNGVKMYCLFLPGRDRGEVGGGGRHGAPAGTPHPPTFFPSFLGPPGHGGVRSRCSRRPEARSPGTVGGRRPSAVSIPGHPLFPEEPLAKLDHRRGAQKKWSPFCKARS